MTPDERAEEALDAMKDLFTKPETPEQRLAVAIMKQIIADTIRRAEAEMRGGKR